MRDMMVVTSEQLLRLHAQTSKLFTDVGNGSLDPEEVSAALRVIIEKQGPNSILTPASLNSNTPVWYVSPEQQIERARQLWPNVVLPDPPKDFVRRTETEVLLLHVPNTFDELWRNVTAPPGYTKRNGGVGRKRKLLLAPNVTERRKPVWVAFDPEHGKGKAARDLWGDANLASSEVLSALIQFPAWCLSWGKFDVSAPSLSGYRWRASVPLLCRDDQNGELRVDYSWSREESDLASPSAREC